MIDEEVVKFVSGEEAQEQRRMKSQNPWQNDLLGD